MDTLRRKVSTLLRRRFRPPAVVRLRDDDGIFGTVTSEEFRNLDTMERLHSIWGYLENKLTAEEKYNISVIVPMTPEEAQDDEDE